MKAAYLIAAAMLSALAAPADEETLETLVTKAGNAGTEVERLAVLADMLALPGLEAGVRADVERLHQESAQWIDGKKLEHFGQAPLKTGDYDLGIAPDSPVYPLTWIYRGRASAWTTLEYGGLWSAPEKRRIQLDHVRGYFEKAREAFPENTLVNMYLGEALPASKAYPFPETAPAWARYQREGLERLTDIIEWWIEHRQRPDAQYGGGWGDDCEMWRWWTPILIAFEHPLVNDAQARFSEALWNQPHMAAGYTSHVFDVEHTAEDSADTLVPMMHLRPDDPVWRARTLRLVELAESLWMGVNDRGMLQFKGTYFSAETVDPDPRKACDTVYHPRALQPALLLWQRTHDPRLEDLFARWMDTWAEASMREERGKPGGVVPSAIHWPDGGVGGLGAHWWDPENHSDDPLYVWPSALGQMLNTLLEAHLMTGKSSYLDPLLAMARIRVAYLQDPPESAPEAGSSLWCAAKLAPLAPVAAKYKLLTGRSDFDALLESETVPYMGFRLSGDLAGLSRALEQNADALGINFPGYTSEVRYTDRVLRFPSLFQENGIFPEAVTGIPTPDPALLYSTATGDPDNGILFPVNAVRWKTIPRDIAALVVNARDDYFEARLFHFGELPRKMVAEFFLLKPGEYTATLDTASGNTIHRATLPAETRELSFELPPREECVLILRPGAA